MNAAGDCGPGGWPLTDERVWIDAPAARRRTAARPVLFLDRDGIVIADRDFVADAADVALVPGAAALIRAANAAAIPVAIVTNQSGIDRGLFGWEAFAEVQAETTRRLAEDGAQIDAVAACPFHPDFTEGYGAAHAYWRKPGPGMVDALAQALNADRNASWMIGDSARDLQSAHDAGIGGLILVAGKPGEPSAALPPDTHRAGDVKAAFEFLRGRGAVA